MRLIIGISIYIIFITQYSFGYEKCTFIGYREKNEVEELNKTKCAKHSVCGRHLSISYIDFPPFSRGKVFENVIDRCCGSHCVKLDVEKYYTNISEVELSKDTSDFILPILGSSAANEMFGYHFIPFASAPQAYYITPKHSPPLSRMMSKCRGLYLLMAICLMACTISGFIVWTFEKLSTKKDDNQSFFLNLFETF